MFIRAEWKRLLAMLFMVLLGLGCVAVSVSQFVQFFAANQPWKAQDVAFQTALYLLVSFANLCWLWRARWRSLLLVIFTSIMAAVYLVLGGVDFLKFLAANQPLHDLDAMTWVDLSLLGALFCLWVCGYLVGKIKPRYILWKHRDTIRDMLKEAGCS
jgi:hypothetical protein